MRDDPRFALVLKTSDNDVLKDCPFEYGICLVDGDSATTTFVNGSGLAKAVRDYACVPSSYGKQAALVSFEAEMEAVDALLSAAEELTAKYGTGVPAGYMHLHSMSAGGLRVAVKEEWISVEIADWVLKAAGWHVGDRIAVAVDAAGSFLIHLDKDGAPLVASDNFGWSTAVRDWRLSVRERRQDGQYDVFFAVSGRSVVFELPLITTPAPVPTAVAVPPQTETLPPRLPIDYRWGPLALAAVYSAVTLALNFV